MDSEKGGVLVTWPGLKDHFGDDYERLRDFRRVFTRTLRQVKVVYPEAKFELTSGGMKLRHSRPPVGKRLLNLKPE